MKTSTHPRLRRCLLLLAGLMAVVLIGLTVTGLAGRWWWAFAMTQHPRPHYMMGLAVLAIVFRIHEQKRWYLACFGMVLLNAAVILFATNTSAARTSPRTNLTITHINLDRDNQNIDSVVDYIHGLDDPPTILCLQEYTPRWDEQLRQKLIGYHWIKAIPRDDSRGSAMLMRADHPSLEVWRVHVLQWLPGEQDRPTLAVEFSSDINSLPLVVLSLHAKRPRDRATSDIQQREFQAAAAWCEQRLMNRHLIVIGDFNTTPWNTSYRRFLNQSGLNHAAGTLMWGTTFPADLPFPLRLPIDLCAIDEGVWLSGIAAGPDIGSDHRPLTMSFDAPGF